MIIHRKNPPRAQYADYGQTNTFRIGGGGPSTGGPFRPGLLALLAVVVLAGVGISKGWFADGIIPWTQPTGNPLPQATASPQASASPSAAPTTLPAEAPASAAVQSVDLEIPPLSYYCVQIAYFQDADNAQEMASTLGTQEMAAYVWQDDDRYRVLDTASLDQDTARTRANTLRQAELAEPCLTRQSIPGAKLTITASEEQTLSIQEGMDAILAMLEGWTDWVDGYDAQTLSESALREAMAEEAGRLSQAQERLATYIEPHDASGTVAAMVAFMDRLGSAASQVLATETENSLAFSQTLRYNQLDVLYGYKEFMAELSPSA